jgi:dihydroflavonol-4-reductase
MARTVLITGISGFIAKYCALDLLQAGYRVRGTVRDLARAATVRTTLAAYGDADSLDFVEADLLADEGWDAALQGVDCVLHLASPFPLAQPDDPDELLRPAVEGTRRVVGAAVRAGVPRLVQTSSVAAIFAGHPRDRETPYTEADWTIVDGPGVTVYERSKTLAEREGRAIAATAGPSFHYSTVNPGFVLGPALDADVGASADLVLMMLKGRYPGVPRMSFPVVDVRDVAKAHRLALETARPSGGRYLVASEPAWMIDIARAVKAGLGEEARKVPTRELPDFVIRMVAVFDGAARTSVPKLGLHSRFDNSATRAALGMEFIPLSESAPAMARSLIALGLV